MTIEEKKKLSSSYEEVKSWKKAEKKRKQQPILEIWDNLIEKKEDEVFSSWFTRIAKVNYAEPIRIINNLRKRKINPNKYDLDKNIYPLIFNKIAKFTKQQSSSLLQMCLIPNNKKYRNGRWNYVINPIDGTRFCPFCLEEDKNEPYFRKYWRLRFFTICIKHNCFLLDKCPHCGEPVRYWITEFYQSILECYSCGKNIIHNLQSVKKIDENSMSEVKLQRTLFDVFKNKVWNDKPIDPFKFFRQLWKIAWFETVDPKNWDKEEFSQSIISTFNAIQLSLKEIILDPDRIEKPFSCHLDNKKYRYITGLLNHMIKHTNLRCPVKKCKSRRIWGKNNIYRCRNCGTEFNEYGKIIKKGLKLQKCPLEECGSNFNNITPKEDRYRCRICGSEFTSNGKIIKKGKKIEKCPSEECDSIEITRKGTGYVCRACRTEFTAERKITSNGMKPRKCPIRECGSTTIRRRRDDLRCQKCGTVFTIKGKIIKKGFRHKECPLEGCNNDRIVIKGNGYWCKSCRTEFTADGKITKRGKKPERCPLKNCGSKTFGIKGNNYICRFCGTEFTEDEEIIRKGKRVKKCPLEACKMTNNIRIKGNGYRCRACGTEFTIKGKITKNGGRPKCPLEECGSRGYVRPKGHGYRCRACGTEFELDGKITKKRMKIKKCLLNNCDSGTFFVKGKGFRCNKCNTEFMADGKIIKKRN